MQIRFASWNVNGFRRLDAQRDLMREVSPNILALQEVTPHAYAVLASAGIFDWMVFSLTLRESHAGEGRKRRLGCVLCGDATIRPTRAALIEECPVPERALYARLETPAGPWTACSFHVPPGVTWGEAKPQTFHALARWLHAHSGLITVGIDANAPKTDHPDLSQNEWWWKDAELVLLGANARHPLRDALRLYLDRHPEQFETIKRERPRGPLATSHMRGRRDVAKPCRYDFVLVSPDIGVARVQYLYDEAVAAGSDHAMVVTELILPDGPFVAAR